MEERITTCESCGTTENIYDPDSAFPLCCDCEEEMRCEMADLVYSEEFSATDEATQRLKDALGLD